VAEHEGPAALQPKSSVPPPGGGGERGLPMGEAGTRFEAWAVVAIVLAMVLLPTAKALLRRLTGAELPGAAVYTQHLTLWVGFIGALLATAAGKHLALSTLEMLPAGRVRNFARGYGDLVSAFVSAVLAYASLVVVLADRTRPDTLAGGLPEWWTEVIVPIGFVVMAFRFARLSPQRGTRIAGYVLAALVLPFCAGAVADAFGVAGFPVVPDASALFGAHTGWIAWPGALLLLAAFLLGTPVFVVMAGFALLLFFLGGTPVASVPAQTFLLVGESSLPAIPLLTAAGYLLAESNASNRLVRAAQSLVGWLPGGLAIMSVFVCAIFTTFTGASGVTILAVGGILFPSLVKAQYPEGFSLGLVTASGSLGLLFFPSIPVLLYAVVAQLSIHDLYIGGFVPGVLMIVLVAGYGMFIGLRSKTPRQPFSFKEARQAVWDAKWDLGLPVLVVVAVVSGFATIVEAAALGAAYAIVVELVIFRDLHPTRDLPRVLEHASTLVGSVIILLGIALGITNYLVDAEVPTLVVNWVQQHIHHQWQFLLVLNLLLLVLGSVLEIYSAILVLAPLVAPLGRAFNVEPVHLGVVFLANLELGFLFPPMGLNLFLSASRFRKPLPVLYREAMPFLIIMSIGVLLITYWPAITTGVLAAMTGP